MTILTGSRLEQLLTYDPGTGIFTWRGGQKKVRAGMVAGTPDKDGYINICIDQQIYKAHRLAWLWMTGEWPTEEIDHKDLDKANNRFSNLREATHSQNQINRKKRGYTFDKRRGAFVAQIKENGKHRHLGQFKTSVEASAAYNEAANAIHGEFARTAR